jgi:hypothetical protein
VGGISHPCVGLVSWEVVILLFWSKIPTVVLTSSARYRSTATLVSLIIQAGYRSPHRTIDKYVEAFTDFKPSDGSRWTQDEPELLSGFTAEVTKLNFDKMSESLPLALEYQFQSVSSFSIQIR